MTVVPLHPPQADALVVVSGLTVRTAGGAAIVDDVSLAIGAGEILGLVGESGSGKSTLAHALLGHAVRGARIVAGRVVIDGEDILGLRPRERAARLGTVVAHVPQDPAQALNPRQRIGDALDETLRCHEPALTPGERRRAIDRTLATVDLPTTFEFLRRHPHELSGGQQQRVLLALAFLLAPRLVVLDEPTTALDSTTQARVLETIGRACREHGVAALIVSHDLGSVAQLVDRVAVLYAGRVAEVAPLRGLIERPRHHYTAALLRAAPDPGRPGIPAAIAGLAPAPGEAAGGCGFAPRCPAATALCARQEPRLSAVGADRQVACHHPRRALLWPIEQEPPRPAATAAPLLIAHRLAAWHGGPAVVEEASFTLARGRCTALVGQSGSGKTTLARLLAGLHPGAAGEMWLDGQKLALPLEDRAQAGRGAIQYVFQNPMRSLNPRRTIAHTLGAALKRVRPDRADSRSGALAALRRVGLEKAHLDRFPGELSGGQRQRVAIARALLAEPALLICDEVTSALDVSVQAAVLRLLADLRDEGLALLFVTHDLGVVRALADDVLVLDGGAIVERGTVDEVMAKPAHPFTRQLLASAARLPEPRLPPAGHARTV